MKEWGQKIRAALEGSMRQQITKLGFYFSVTVALVGLAAFASGNNLLFLLLAALLSTMLISGFVSRLGLAGLELNLQIPEHIAARRTVHGRMTLRNRKWISPSFSLHLVGADGSGLRDTLYIPLIPARSVTQHSVDLWFPHRGIHTDNTFWFESRFPFGFTHRRAQVHLKREVLVYPCLDLQPGFDMLLADINGEIDARQRGRGTDFYRIRPYAAMESARHVDWKATAHTGDLQVREFSREQDQAVTIFLDLHLPQSVSHDWFDLAVDCCAFLVWQLNERGTRVRVLTQRFDRRLPEEVTVYDVLRHLALVQPVFGANRLIPDDRNLPIAISARDPDEAGWIYARLPDTQTYAGGPDADPDA
ncbi:MAG: DUF58 domain-containing protein [Bryobacteraceae bacterium]|nr:DUF58 domain-containing protein [Bryobacteraceae bacterium]